MIHNPQRANLLHQLVEVEQQSLQSLTEAVRDQGVRDQLRVVSRWVDDVKTHFLQSLEREERTKEQEDHWLFEAEKFFGMATNERRRLQSLIESYGGPENIRMIE